MIQKAIGYKIEPEGIEYEEINSEKKEKEDFKIAEIPDKSILLEDVFDLSGKDNDFLFYRDSIMNKGQNMNFLCSDSNQGPIAISIFDDNQNERYISLVRKIEKKYKKYNTLFKCIYFMVEKIFSNRSFYFRNTSCY
jgi:hypothetical protein